MNKQTIEACLQQGINPYRSPMSTFHHVVVTQIGDNRFTLRVQQRRGKEVLYSYAPVAVGDQTFVSSLKQLATKHRIHRDNYDFKTTD